MLHWLQRKCTRFRMRREPSVVMIVFQKVSSMLNGGLSLHLLIESGVSFIVGHGLWPTSISQPKRPAFSASGPEHSTIKGKIQRNSQPKRSSWVDVYLSDEIMTGDSAPVSPRTHGVSEIGEELRWLGAEYLPASSSSRGTFRRSR